jgi:hypothetical protein
MTEYETQTTQVAEEALDTPAGQRRPELIGHVLGVMAMHVLSISGDTQPATNDPRPE